MTTDSRRPRATPRDPEREKPIPDDKGAATGARDATETAKGSSEDKGKGKAAGPAEAAGSAAAQGAASDEAAQDRRAAETSEWQTKAKENYDLFLRARADYENLARRTQREVSMLVRLGKRDLLLKLLELADNLERAAEAWRRSLTGHDGVDGEGLVGGVEIIGRQLQGILAAEGVRPIDAVGCAFDPSLHECVVTWDTPDVESEVITDEIKRGYTHDGEVLRAAQVRVARPSG